MPEHVDALGRPLICVQRVDSRDGTCWEVIDRRLPTGQRTVGTFFAEAAARDAAAALDERP